MKTKSKIAKEFIDEEEQTISGSPLMTVAELSRYLRKSKDSIYTMKSRKQLPFRKIGRSVRFLREEIDARFRLVSGVNNQG